MTRGLLVFAVLSVLLSFAAPVVTAAPNALDDSRQPTGDEGEESSDFARGYLGVSAALTLPQGGSRLRRLGGGALRGGWYFTEEWAVEGEAAWLEDAAGLAVGALGHVQGWDLYDYYFGYSRFDPFVTFGARGWIGRSGGQVGPKAGLGAFYHLTDAWSLRFDADATLGLETNCEMVYSIAAGVQCSF